MLVSCTRGGVGINGKCSGGGGEQLGACGCKFFGFGSLEHQEIALKIMFCKLKYSIFFAAGAISVQQKRGTVRCGPIDLAEVQRILANLNPSHFPQIGQISLNFQGNLYLIGHELLIVPIKTSPHLLYSINRLRVLPFLDCQTQSGLQRCTRLCNMPHVLY